MDKDNTYTGALIGAGRIGMLLEKDPKRLKPATHFGMMNSHPKINFTAVCDTSEENLKIAKQMNQNIEIYSDAVTMLNEIKPDIVSIATWKDTHYEMMRACVDADIPVIICEKPIAEKFEDALEIVKEIENSGKHLIINHRRRFDSLLYPVIDEIKSGRIGEIIQVSAFYVFGLVTTGTHLIDALRFFLKDVAGEMVWASGFENKFKHHAPPDDPCIDGFIGFENGLKVSLQSMNIQDYDIFNVSFYGRKGMIQFKNIGRDFNYYDVIPSKEHDGFTELSDDPTKKIGGEPRNQFTYMLDNAINCIEGSAKSLSTGRDSLKALQVLLALQESVRENGKVISIPNI